MKFGTRSACPSSVAFRCKPQHTIINVLRYHEAQNAFVFANTRATVNRLTARFANHGFAVVCLSGELSQAERTHVLQAMDLSRFGSGWGTS